MAGATLLAIARQEARMQFRRRYVWPMAGLILVTVWALVSPFNEPGAIYDPDQLAADSMRLCLSFSGLLMAFLVSDRIVRDDVLKTRECILAKPVATAEYALGKCLGSTVFCLVVFVVPTWAMVQVEQLVLAGPEYYDAMPFLKAYALYPPVFVFFVVATAVALASRMGDPLRFFALFTLIWCGVLFLMTPGYDSYRGVLDFSGNPAIRVLLPQKNIETTTRAYVVFALNLSTMIAGAGLALIFVTRHLSRDESLELGGRAPRRRRGGRLQRFLTRNVFWYNGRILSWGTYNGVLAAVFLLSAILLKGTGTGKSQIVQFTCEAILPLVFAFTTTHCFVREKNAGMLETLLSKPFSRTRHVLDRFAWRLAPSILVTALVAFGAGLLHDDVSIPGLMGASVTTLAFMSAVSLSVGLWTDDARFGAVVIVFWFLAWTNRDIQAAAEASGILAAINPFAYTFGPASGVVANKAVLLLGATGALAASCAAADRPERFL